MVSVNVVGAPGSLWGGLKEGGQTFPGPPQRTPLPPTGPCPTLWHCSVTWEMRVGHTTLATRTATLCKATHALCGTEGHL